MLGKYFTRQGNGRWDQQTWSVKLGRWLRHAPQVYLAAAWDLIVWVVRYAAAPLQPVKWDDGKIAKTFTRWDTLKLWWKAARARLDSRIGNYMTGAEFVASLRQDDRYKGEFKSGGALDRLDKLTPEKYREMVAKRPEILGKKCN